MRHNHSHQFRCQILVVPLASLPSAEEHQEKQRDYGCCNKKQNSIAYVIYSRTQEGQLCSCVEDTHFLLIPSRFLKLCVRVSASISTPLWGFFVLASFNSRNCSMRSSQPPCGVFFVLALAFTERVFSRFDEAVFPPLLQHCFRRRILTEKKGFDPVFVTISTPLNTIPRRWEYCHNLDNTIRCCFFKPTARGVEKTKY